MCWTSRIRPKPKIAKEDMFTFKMMINTERKRKDSLVSPIFKRVYYLKEIVTIQDGVRPSVAFDGTFFINEGIHSYSTSCYVVKKGDRYVVKSQEDLPLLTYPFVEGYDYSLVSCIIPKGTVYYINENGEVVSGTIKIHQKFEIS